MSSVSDYGENLIYSKSSDSQIHTISFNRPKKLNAITFEQLGEIKRCIETEINPYTSGARVLIIKSEGKVFTAGLDMNSAA